jgi:c-di-GMP-binding flagellar brake protein YcgR
MSQNRRQFSRVNFNTEARLYVQGHEFSVEVLDISLKGALIRTEKAVDITAGSNAVLQLRLDEMGTLIRMEGPIAHSQRGDFGIYCREIDLDSITHLRRLVELNLGDEGLLEREFSHLVAE